MREPRFSFQHGMTAACLTALVLVGCDRKSTADGTTTGLDKPSAEPAFASEPMKRAAAATAAPLTTHAPEPTATAAEPSKATPTPNETGKVPAVANIKTSKEVKPKKGPDASTASFSTWLQSSGSYQAGKQGNVTAVLVAKAPFKCNAKYPYKFKLNSPTDGVIIPETTVRGMQVSPKRSTMAIPFTGSKTGKATVSGTLSFSICTDERCIIDKRPLSVTVDIQ